MLRLLPTTPLIQFVGPDQHDTTIAEQLHTSRGRVRRMRRTDTRISWLEADRFAIRLGVHPITIWGHLWTDEATDLNLTEPPLPV